MLEGSFNFLFVFERFVDFGDFGNVFHKTKNPFVKNGLVLVTDFLRDTQVDNGRRSNR